MREDILRMENYGLLIDEEIVKYGFARKGSVIQFTSVTKFVETNARMNLVRGDVVEFGSNLNQPKYARNQFGVVIDRFCVTKNKGVIYKDYGSIIMMITGPEKGRILKTGFFMGGGGVNKYVS